MTRSAKEAIAWGRGQIGGPAVWYRKCLVFVRSCFGVDMRYPSAGEAWDAAQHKHRTSRAADIPAGVPVFWETSGEADHVALSTGNGRCLSNDFKRSGHIDEVGIDEISRGWNAVLLGWTEDLNGVRVYSPPPPEMTRGEAVDHALSDMTKARRAAPKGSRRRKVLRAAKRLLKSLRSWPKR